MYNTVDGNLKRENPKKCKCKKMKNDKHKDHQQLVILEGFRQNGHHH